MRRRYVLAPEAALDLVQIWRYIKNNGSLEMADRVESVICEKIAYLSGRPGAGHWRLVLDRLPSRNEALTDCCHSPWPPRCGGASQGPPVTTLRARSECSMVRMSKRRTVIAGALSLLSRTLFGQKSSSATATGPVAFGYKMAWLAVRTVKTTDLVSYLKLEDRRPATWVQGCRCNFTIAKSWHDRPWFS